MNAAIAMSWDLTNPKQFLVSRKGMDAGHVDEMEVEYRRYLACIAAMPGMKLPISSEVDELWHAHILFTKDYQRMSSQLIGHYVEHVPTLSEEERMALEPFYFDGTLATYERLFGHPAPEKFWPRVSGSICLSCSSPTLTH